MNLSKTVVKRITQRRGTLGLQYAKYHFTNKNIHPNMQLSSRATSDFENNTTSRGNETAET